MKWMLGLGALLLSACSSGAGGGSGASLCPLPGEFDANKVQISGTPGVTYDPNENFAQFVSGAKRVASSPSTSLLGGTEITALVRNACETPGPITSTIELDEASRGLPGVRSYPFRLFAPMSLESLRELADTDSCLVGLADTTVDSVSALPTDPMAGEQRHLSALDAGDAYPVFYDPSLGTRKSVVIAIVDTGVDIDHEDLRESLWVNSNEIPDNGIDDDRNGYIDDIHGYNFAASRASPSPQGGWSGNYHGTHVAGLAAAKGYNGKGVSGVMGAGARIMALNVFGSSPGAFNYHTENAIRYAADNGADVINLSIGGSSGSASYKAAIEYAVSKGVSIFAAAGNEHRDLGPKYFLTPGAYAESIEGMMAVGSVDSASQSWSRFSNYSSSFVEIAAPGAENSQKFLGLLSTMPNGRYSRLQGTSMASPVVSGAAALAIQLLRVRGYAATPARIEAVLGNSSQVSELLADKVKGGRVLSLKNLAEYITRSYPKLETPEPGATTKTGAGIGAPLIPCP